MEQEAPFYQARQVETRSRNADQIVITRRKRTHQEMDNQNDERDKKLAEEEEKLNEALNKVNQPKRAHSSNASNISRKPTTSFFGMCYGSHLLLKKSSFLSV